MTLYITAACASGHCEACSGNNAECHHGCHDYMREEEMAKGCVFRIKAEDAELKPFRDYIYVSVFEDRMTVLTGWMSRDQWSAFRSGLMPNSHVDFIIEEEEDGKRSD